MYPYDFLTAAEMAELENLKFVSREQRATAEAQWLYTLMNRIDEWVLVAPKCHQGEPLGEHPVITSIKQNKLSYDAACKKGEAIALPTQEAEIIKLEQIEELHIAPHRATGENILQPSDSYSTIETLVDKPIDYVLENIGGLAAPEDDEEPNENLMKGKVAHKVVELLVNKDPDGAYSFVDIQNRYETQFESLYKEAMEKEPEAAAFLNLEENKNVLAVFKNELRDSIAKLIAIIKEKELKPIRCEYEVNTPFKPFDNPHGFVDMLLEDKDGNLVIFDFKWSTLDVYQKGIKDGEAYQLYMYKRAVEAQTKRPVAWYAYYLFPMMELYEEPEGAQPKWDEWLLNRTAQLEQIDNGTIEYDAKKDEYPKHLILKNLKLQ
jgi:RecB family exonuclease